MMSSLSCLVCGFFVSMLSELRTCPRWNSYWASWRDVLTDGGQLLYVVSKSRFQMHQLILHTIILCVSLNNVQFHLDNLESGSFSSGLQGVMCRWSIWPEPSWVEVVHLDWHKAHFEPEGGLDLSLNPLSWNFWLKLTLHCAFKQSLELSRKYC